MTYLEEACKGYRPWGGGYFYEAASAKLSELVGASKILLTQSCTAALELAALTLELGEGDEVIVPSYTFVTSASAFALRGVRIVFVDVDKETLNVRVDDVLRAITSKTKAIVVVHYGGVAAPVKEIVDLANPKGIFVIEDAAQAIDAYFDSNHLGTIGDIGCISFHGTKNVSSGEGGAAIFRSDRSDLYHKAEVIHEKGTDRKAFFEGKVDKYTWRKLGSSFVPSEFTSAILLSQLEEARAITRIRQATWSNYRDALRVNFGKEIEIVSEGQGGSNGHMFAFLAQSPSKRDQILSSLNQAGVGATSHYTALHSSPFGSRFRIGDVPALPVTDSAAGRLIRLPVWSVQGLPMSSVIEVLKESWG